MNYFSIAQNWEILVKKSTNNRRIIFLKNVWNIEMNVFWQIAAVMSLQLISRFSDKNDALVIIVSAWLRPHDLRVWELEKRTIFWPIKGSNEGNSGRGSPAIVVAIVVLWPQGGCCCTMMRFHQFLFFYSNHFILLKVGLFI